MALGWSVGACRESEDSWPVQVLTSPTARATGIFFHTNTILPSYHIQVCASSTCHSPVLLLLLNGGCVRSCLLFADFVIGGVTGIRRLWFAENGSLQNLLCVPRGGHGP